MNFKEYLKNGKVKRKTADSQEGKALLDQAGDRLNYIKDKEINPKTAKFILEDAYEAVREAAQGLMSMKGYKPYSHEATISFVKEFHRKDFSQEDIANFDHFRGLRNDSIYRALVILPSEAKSCLSFAKKFVRKARAI